ncbi:MAG TPA: SMC-Scp complex subunit ScpB [Candidatus Angelobacter sp.]|jgi:segregation and condensation protein B|nr:SMC-Scp complex subunit ScpB [Candidatus Angelobacter sp.]
MSIRAKLEALIYAAEEPITLDQMAALMKEDLLALREQPEPELQPHPEQAEEHLGAVEADRPEEAVAPAAEEVQTEAAPAKKAKGKDKEKSEKVILRELLRPVLEEVMAEFNREDHGIEIRQVAGGYRMSTKPEHHDVVRSFAKSLKPPIRLSLQALETLAVIAYKQPVTVPEISDIRGVDSSGVIGTLLERKLITTAGRKAVVGRPMLYKTTKDFLMRFGLSDISELPSLEEFEKLAAGELQEEMFAARDTAIADATGVPDMGSDEQTAKQNQAGVEEQGINENTDEQNANEQNISVDGGVEQLAEDKAEHPQTVTEPTVSSDPRHNAADDQATDQVASESTGG